MIKLTYFTPTYNRKQLLENLYNSLKQQTNKNFEWLIIDDGSTDSTEEVVNKWITEKIINIKYVWKENGGKNSAMDMAHEICKTEYIACIDSDDYLTNDSTEILYKYLNKVSENDNLVGIVGRRAHYDGIPFNDAWSKDAEEIYFNEIQKKYGYTQDTVLIFKTNIVKNFKFPKFEGENFVTETVLYNQFMYDYKILMIPECIYLAEYQEVGYTSQGMNLFYKNPKGYLYALKQNAVISIKNKEKFKEKIYKSALFYAWKKQADIEDVAKNEYKIAFPYNFLGWLCAKTILKNVYKK